MNREEDVPTRAEIAALRKEEKDKDKDKNKDKKDKTEKVLSKLLLKDKYPALDEETVQMILDDESSYEPSKKRIVRYV